MITTHWRVWILSGQDGLAQEVRRAIHLCLGQDPPWVEGGHAPSQLFEQCLQFHRGSSEGEAEGFGAAVEELDLKTAAAARARPSGQTVQPLRPQRAPPRGLAIRPPRRPPAPP